MQFPPTSLSNCHRELLGDFQLEIQRNTTVYKIVYSDVTEKPEGAFNVLKELVGERGFEPPTPWSRTRFQSLLKSVVIRCL
jgi:hypothetical protein